MDINEKLTEAMLLDGFVTRDEDFVCLYCGEHFNKEQIYDLDGGLFNGHYAAKNHVEKKHGGPLKAMLSLSGEVTGISETQRNLMQLLSLDLTDHEIAEQLDISPSTIRNHRFKLKEKKRQALYFIAVMDLLEDVNQKLQANELTIRNYDERFQINDKERSKVLQTFINEEGRASIPRKEKSKIILLQQLAASFSDQKIYSETEVNQLIMTMFDDYVSIRRYMIQYGFLARTNDGRKYWKI